MPTRRPPRYSVTCRSDEEPVIRCLNALANYMERRRYGGRPGGAVAERLPCSAHIRLRFTHPDDRAGFLELAADLFGGRWTLCAESEDDPALAHTP